MGKKQDIEILLDIRNMTNTPHGAYINELIWLINFLEKVPERSSVKPYAIKWLATIRAWGVNVNPYFQFRVDITNESKNLLESLAAKEIEKLQKDRARLQAKLTEVNSRLRMFHIY